MRGDCWPDIDAQTLLQILQMETRRATGCTEIAAAALVAAKASQTLQSPLRSLHLLVSPNVYKNGIHAGVPGTDLCGLAAAAALGAVIADSSTGLEILSSATPQHQAQARLLLERGQITVQFVAGKHPLQLQATANGFDATASATIAGSHDHFVEVTRDKDIVFNDLRPLAELDPLTDLQNIPVAQLLELVLQQPPEAYEFLITAAEVNRQAADAAIAARVPLATALNKRSQAEGAPRRTAQALAGAASEARMHGFQVPVMAISGSGNHGLANFLGVLGVAQELNVDRATLAKALAVASVVTLCIKAHTGRLSAFCGCAIAPATGVAAATSYMLGGDITTQKHAMQSVLGTFAGMVCDGAKVSCAYKVATVVGSAADFGAMAVEGAFIPDGDGILGQTVDDSFANLAHLNSQGMQQTEAVILRLVS